MTASEQPYLSVVVTTRNDDHGVGLLRRTQIFVDALIAQLTRFRLPAELVMVEWNPPADRPPLCEVIRWPTLPDFVSVRLIQVPAIVHSTYRNAESLPLYQMIAKNVGIRRARGQFVLATNIDILFSDDLMAFLAARSLDNGKMYRIDRHDVMSDVPVEAPVEEQLDYCATHILRVNARGRTYSVLPEGEPVTAIPVAAPFGTKIASDPVSQAAPAPQKGVFGKIIGVFRRAAEGGPVIQVWVPIPRVVRRLLRSCMGLPSHSVELPVPVEVISEPCEAAAPDEPVLLTVEGANLHTNACGDFTLMAKYHWFDLRGYPEWDVYSFHLDSVTCHAAHNAGVRELVLEEPMRIYHIEHGQGSGWTPEGERKLFERLKAKGIPWIEYEELMRWAAEMRRLSCPMIFNLDNWGLAGHDLPEIAPK